MGLVEGFAEYALGMNQKMLLHNKIIWHFNLNFY